MVSSLISVSKGKKLNSSNRPRLSGVMRRNSWHSTILKFRLYACSPMTQVELLKNLWKTTPHSNSDLVTRLNFWLYFSIIMTPNLWLFSTYRIFEGLNNPLGSFPSTKNEMEKNWFWFVAIVRLSSGILVISHIIRLKLISIFQKF